MANQNPISIGSEGPFVDYTISAANVNAPLLLTISVQLLDQGWKYTAMHEIAVAGANIYNDVPEPQDFPLGVGTVLVGNKMRIYSHVDRAINGAAVGSKPSRVKYTLTFSANGNTLDQFDVTSDETNPEDFISNIQFKLV